MSKAKSEGASPTKRGRRPGPAGPTVVGGSRDARRLAAVLLEVLAGLRTPADAAANAGVSLPRFYALESRALGGLIAACEPRPRGRRASPERETAKLRAEVKRLERLSARSQALLRLSQRTIGVAPPAKPDRGKGKRPRRPVARGLHVAARLRSELQSTVEEAGDAKVA